MKKIFLFIPSFLFSLSTSPGDFPIARILARGEFKFGIRFQKEGGILFSLDAAILDRFSMGIRYGGMEIVGNRDINFYPMPGVNVSYLLIEESSLIPALLFGIETQGFDEYIDGSDRYFVKSRGIFLSVTKNFFAGLSLTAGVNRTFETRDEKNGMDAFSSLILNFSPEFGIFTEYAFAFNDPLHNKGIFNTGVSFNLEDKFFFSFIFRDLFSYKEIRTFYVGYKGYL